MKTQKKPAIYFLLGVISTSIVASAIFGSRFPLSEAKENMQTSNFKFPVYVNGESIALEDALLVDGKTYVQLREFSEKINVDVAWKDPKHHTLPIPGGNLPGGINLTNPTFIYTKEVTDFYNTAETIKGVEITGLRHKYQAQNENLKYAFDDYGLVIRDKGQEKKIPLKFNPSQGRAYLSVSEFKEKLLPYLVDMCMQ